MKSKSLYEYMLARADFEGVPFQLSPDWFEVQFKLGCRIFFGVTVDDDGKLLADNQAPGFFTLRTPKTESVMPYGVAFMEGSSRIMHVFGNDEDWFTVVIVHEKPYEEEGEFTAYVTGHFTDRDHKTDPFYNGPTFRYSDNPESFVYYHFQESELEQPFNEDMYQRLASDLVGQYESDFYEHLESLDSGSDGDDEPIKSARDLN